MTDGVQTVPKGTSKTSLQILRNASAPLKKKGIEIITLGIGKSIILEDLVEIATDDTGVFLAEDFSALDEIVTDVREGKCPGRRLFSTRLYVCNNLPFSLVLCSKFHQLAVTYVDTL